MSRNPIIRLLTKHNKIFICNPKITSVITDSYETKSTKFLVFVFNENLNWNEDAKRLLPKLNSGIHDPTNMSFM